MPINNEFQELMRQFEENAENSARRVYILNSMKANLKERNEGESSYTFGYTTPGRFVDIDEVTLDHIDDLFAVNGDMNPQGK